jgi:Flagellar hook-associated protein
MVASAANPPTITLASALYAEIIESRDAGTGGREALGLVGGRRPVDMISEWTALRESAAGSLEREAGFRRGAAEAVREEALAASAVDTDEELRRLLAIEKAYAANARVLQVADDMLAALLQST